MPCFEECVTAICFLDSIFGSRLVLVYIPQLQLDSLRDLLSTENEACGEALDCCFCWSYLKNHKNFYVRRTEQKGLLLYKSKRSCIQEQEILLSSVTVSCGI